VIQLLNIDKGTFGAPASVFGIEVIDILLIKEKM